MKSILKLTTGVFAAALLSIGFVSCSEDTMDDINKDLNHATDADADAYFDAEVKPRLAANPLKETLIQKYLSMWGANGESLETFNDVRRLISLGEEGLLELANTKRFPLRYTYGSSDTTTNPNVNSAYGDGHIPKLQIFSVEMLIKAVSPAEGLAAGLRVIVAQREVSPNVFAVFFLL